MTTILKSLSQLSHVAIDIETVPSRPLCEHEPMVQDTIKAKIEKLRKSDPGITYEKFASLHPSLGRIVCLSAGYSGEMGLERQPTLFLKSYTGSEADLLNEFNRDFSGFRNTWVHFNGRSFDVPFIVTRMRLQKICCRIPDFANLDSANGIRHLDLLEYHAFGDPAKRVSLAVLAALTGLPSPKKDLDGATVFEAFEAGEIRRIARYCERDVATTLNLLRHLVAGLPPVPPERLYSVECDGEYVSLSGMRSDGSCPSVWEDDRTVFPSSEIIPAMGSLPKMPAPQHERSGLAGTIDVQLSVGGKIAKADLRASR